MRYPNGAEISPHLRLRDIYQLYAGVRPVHAYPHAPQRLADQRVAQLDLVIIRKSTEGLFYSAAVYDRAVVAGDDNAQDAVSDIMRITRHATHRLHEFAFTYAARRRTRGFAGALTCVDKVNVFASQNFFRSIFDDVKAAHPDIVTS